MSQYHISIQEESQLPSVQKCSQCCLFYHCPLCSPHIFKPTHRYKVNRHLRCHLLRAVHFRGYSIYKCNLGCRPQAHFHCFCEKLFLNRSQFAHHLNAKHELLPTIDVSGCSGVKANDDDDGDDAVDDTLSSCEANYTTTCTSHRFSNVVSKDTTLNTEDGSASASDESCQSKIGPKKVGESPQCNTVTNGDQNMHMNVKHSSRTSSVTSSSSLKTRESTPVVGGSASHLNPTPVELEILSQLRVLRQQQSQILHLLLKLTNNESVNDSTAAPLRVEFPVTDEEGLAALELKLNETPDLKNRLISCFGDNDGLPIDQTVQRILEKMLSNSFAKRMDWRGKNNKVSFESSCLKEIVNDAVRRNSVCARAADEAVESMVKKWLQQAGEREEGN